MEDEMPIQRKISEGMRKGVMPFEEEYSTTAMRTLHRFDLDPIQHDHSNSSRYSYATFRHPMKKWDVMIKARDSNLLTGVQFLRLASVQVLEHGI
jgi:hypothetical protein